METERKENVLESGLGIYDDAIPTNLRRGLVDEYELPGIDVCMALGPGANISAHASHVCVTMKVRSGLNGVEFKGSFEQLRYLCLAWMRQLERLESQANGDVSETESPKLETISAI